MDTEVKTQKSLTKEQVMMRILHKRGYIVTWQPIFVQPFSVGYVLNKLGAEGLELGNFIVTAKTSQRDFFQQCLLSKQLAPHLWTHGSPTQHVQRGKKLCGKIKYWRIKPTRRKKAEALLSTLEGKI